MICASGEPVDVKRVAHGKWTTIGHGDLMSRMGQKSWLLLGLRAESDRRRESAKHSQSSLSECRSLGVREHTSLAQICLEDERKPNNF
jgi:hypothetical protein